MSHSMLPQCAQHSHHVCIMHTSAFLLHAHQHTKSLTQTPHTIRACMPYPALPAYAPMRHHTDAGHTAPHIMSFGHSISHTICLHMDRCPLGVADRLHYCMKGRHMLCPYDAWACGPHNF